ncbi:hypothetical protein AAG570_001529 [Ranatra chinensis]|uniref:C2H2-type domain-containing protein n=1 Tax=Ranatra chinensis TaxID=642074 RepID=A0ABD0Y932_9HEMI
MAISRNRFGPANSKQQMTDHNDHNHSFGCDHCLFTTYRRKCLVNHLKRKHCDIDETSSVTDGEGEPSLPTVSRRRCLSEGSSGATRWQVAGSGGRGGGCLCARCNLTRPSTRRKPPLSSEWITAINYPLGSQEGCKLRVPISVISCLVSMVSKHWKNTKQETTEIGTHNLMTVVTIAFITSPHVARKVGLEVFLMVKISPGPRQSVVKCKSLLRSFLPPTANARFSWSSSFSLCDTNLWPRSNFVVVETYGPEVKSRQHVYKWIRSFKECLNDVNEEAILSVTIPDVIGGSTGISPQTSRETNDSLICEEDSRDGG